jgi:hypothetical protein
MHEADFKRTAFCDRCEEFDACRSQNKKKLKTNNSATDAVRMTHVGRRIENARNILEWKNAQHMLDGDDKN